MLHDIDLKVLFICPTAFWGRYQKGYNLHLPERCGTARSKPHHIADRLAYRPVGNPGRAGGSARN